MCVGIDASVPIPFFYINEIKFAYVSRGGGLVIPFLISTDSSTILVYLEISGI